MHFTYGLWHLRKVMETIERHDRINASLSWRHWRTWKKVPVRGMFGSYVQPVYNGMCEDAITTMAYGNFALPLVALSDTEISFNHLILRRPLWILFPTLQSTLTNGHLALEMSQAHSFHFYCILFSLSIPLADDSLVVNCHWLSWENTFESKQRRVKLAINFTQVQLLRHDNLFPIWPVQSRNSIWVS